MTDDRALSPGTYTVDAPCPDCGGLETLLLRVSVVRTSGTDDECTIRLRARSRAVDHACGRLRLFDGVSIRTASGLALSTPEDDA